MTTVQKALLLVGSAKADGASTSGALGSHLFARLAEHGMQTETLLLYRSLRTPERTEALIAAVDAAHLVILAFPLYVDTLPYLVTVALERIAEQRGGQATPPPTRFAAIVNCGFPEAHHNDVALAVCRQFARQSGMEWMGGLALGGGGVVHSQPLAEGGGKVRNLVTSLDLAADALSAGQAIPQQAVELMAKPIIPHAVYVTMGNMGWHITAWQNGVHGKLGARPFA